ncbi:hypothetical protein DPMN_155025 [Dreissena polymorpha]|uniref:Uncharacterized protein n=1 Tax=Dreissena polymorpha TaxID=45954 RepID=A0A9D4FNR3_DREPO|nr:hypothetical protein DPMN_155025 [Dreissena polymorpha]
MDENVHRLVRTAAACASRGCGIVLFNSLTDVDDLDLPAAVKSFTDYVTKNRVEGKKEVWNHFNTQGSRTTNNLRG